MKLPLKRSVQSFAAMFRPPFDGLWLVVLLYYIWCFLVAPHSPIIRGDLPDTDDYMYLNQMLDWLHGQGWYDNLQHRLDPPQGVPIHFSRLAQLPMAALTLFFEFCGLGPKGAATLMAIFYPLILLSGFFATLRWMAGNFMPKDWAGVTAAVVLFANGTMFMFRPGHIDHHGLIVLLVALAMGCILKMLERPEQIRWPLYAGLVLAVGQTIALEILPWLLLLSGWLGLMALAKGGNMARGGLIYGVSLLLGSFVCLALTRLPSDLMTVDVLTYSIVYVILTAAVAVTFTGIALAKNGPIAVRGLVAVILAVGTGLLFLRQFPDLVGGPYGGMDPALSQIILGEITEAKPYKAPNNSWFVVSLVMANAMFATVVTIWFTARARGADLWRWGLMLLLLATALALTVFYQRRFVAVTGMLTVVPLAVLLQRGWMWVGEHWRGRPRTYAEIGLLLLVGPLTTLIYPALVDGRSFNTGLLLFPAISSHEADACGMWELENVLRDKAHYGDHPRLIMSTISAGPELLFRTQHSVLSAPFHMDVAGNLDATRFFSTPYPEEAEAIARRRHVDLVVACRAIPEVYMRISLSKELSKGDNVKDFAPHFIERLMKGDVPPWLKRADIPDLNNFVVYEVLPPS